jgi:hypothetical protein
MSVRLSTISPPRQGNLILLTGQSRSCRARSCVLAHAADSARRPGCGANGRAGRAARRGVPGAHPDRDRRRRQDQAGLGHRPRERRALRRWHRLGRLDVPGGCSPRAHGDCARPRSLPGRGTAPCRARRCCCSTTASTSTPPSRTSYSCCWPVWMTSKLRSTPEFGLLNSTRWRATLPPRARPVQPPRRDQPPPQRYSVLEAGVAVPRTPRC